MNAFEKTISFFSPETALKRTRARLVLEQARKFEAASNTKRTKNWNAKNTGANLEIGESLESLRARSRQLHRDSGIARRITDVLATSGVGTGVIVQASDEKFDEYLRSFTDTTEIDFNRKLDFYAIQMLVANTFYESGECLIKKIIEPKSKFGVSFQVLEGDFLDHSMNFEEKDGSYVIQGVKHNKDGKIVGYYIFNEHPGETFSLKNKSKLYSSEEIMHVFEAKRPGQVRGFPHIAPVMVNIKDVSDTINAELMRRKISTCFAGYIIRPDSVEIDEDAEEMYSRMAPGTLTELEPGYDIKFSSPPAAPEFSAFLKDQIRIIATGAGVTYESLSGDLSGTNFSSAKIGRLEFDVKTKHFQENILINQVCKFMIESFLQVSIVKRMANENTSITYTAPVRPLIDPIQENNALKYEIRNGFISWEEAVRSRGRDPKRVLEQLKKNLDQFKEMGIVLDVDGSRVSLAGNLNPEDKQNEE